MTADKRHDITKQAKKGGFSMPFIHIHLLSGRDDETKKKAAQAILKTASETLGKPESTFVIAFEEYERENWEKDVVQPLIDPIRDKLLIDRGNPV